MVIKPGSADFKIVDHRLQAADFIKSPNQDNRPFKSKPELVVIHAISLPPAMFGTGEIHKLFTNRLDWQADPYYQNFSGLKVSAHLLIERDGKLTQFVDFDKRAWHAGESCFNGKEQCNDFSIGIELEGTDDTEFSEAQYSKLIKVLKAIIIHYKISPEAIVGHSDIAPKRKTDPGPMFNWRKLKSAL